MNELIQSVKGQIILAVIGILLLATCVRWCRDVARTVRQVRSCQPVENELPTEFTRWPALLILACSMAVLAVFYVIGIEQDEDTAILLIFVPSLLVMGLAGLVDPRIIWSVHPDAAGKLPTPIRIIGVTLVVLSFLVGLGWFLWFSLT